jgi:hypothetical protein
VRRFFGYRPNPPAEYLEKGTAAPVNEPQYEGVVFTDGTVALRWRTEFRSTSVWNSYEDFYRVHGHPEYGTVIVWLDDTDLVFNVKQVDSEVGHEETTITLNPMDPIA